MMERPEENAPLQDHIDWLVYIAWEKPIILPLLEHLTSLGLWVVNIVHEIITFFEREDE